MPFNQRFLWPLRYFKSSLNNVTSNGASWSHPNTSTNGSSVTRSSTQTSVKHNFLVLQRIFLCIKLIINIQAQITTYILITGTLRQYTALEEFLWHGKAFAQIFQHHFPRYIPSYLHSTNLLPEPSDKRAFLTDRKAVGGYAQVRYSGYKNGKRNSGREATSNPNDFWPCWLVDEICAK